MSGEEITKDALYNLIIGQTVLPSWRRLEALGPFSVDAPPSSEEFAHRLRERFPKSKGVVPSHLKQGVLNLLGDGPELDFRIWRLPNLAEFGQTISTHPGAPLPTQPAPLRRGEERHMTVT